MTYKPWAWIKRKLEGEGSLNKQYDADLNSVIDLAAIPTIPRSKIDARLINYGKTDIEYSADTTLSSDIFARDITIDAGITVNTGGKIRVIVCRNLVIDGVLTANGDGASGGAGGVATNGNTGEAGGNGAGGGGGGYNTYGGSGGSGELYSGGAGNGSAATFGFDTSKRIAALAGWSLGGIPYGAGGGGGGGQSGGSTACTGGNGGAGGGCIIISCMSLTLNGTISANGLNGVYPSGNYDSGGGGGGSGGSILIYAKSLSGAGTIAADGGNGATGTDNYGGGGAGGNGGHLVILSEDDASTLFTLTVNGGTGGGTTLYGAAGANGNNGVINVFVLD